MRAWTGQPVKTPRGPGVVDLDMGRYVLVDLDGSGAMAFAKGECALREPIPEPWPADDTRLVEAAGRVLLDALGVEPGGLDDELGAMLGAELICAADVERVLERRLRAMLVAAVPRGAPPGQVLTAAERDALAKGVG